MQSNYQKGGNYTTDLIHQDAQVSDSIPTSTSASTLYWNYNNPLTSTTNPIPTHGTPDKIGQRLDAPTNSDQIPIDINVSVDTSIVSGTYENQLLFSAVGNPTTVNYTLTFNMSGGEPAIETMEATAKAGAYTFTLPSTVPTKEGYTFQYWSTGMTRAAYHPGDTVTIYSDEEFTGDLTLTAIFTIDSYSLTVNPNGGTWSGSTSSQTFTQDYNTTKTIANPTANATYSITYNDNGQGATYTGTPTSVNRSFIGWDKAGSGEWNSNTKTYTYGAGDGSLTAQYNNTSDSFVLPAISKTGHTCYWASDASGTKFGDGGESKTISSNTTIFAYCTINQYTLTIKPNGGKWNNKTTDSTIKQNYNTKYPASGALPDATDGPTYSISYNMGSTGIAKPTSPTSASRSFTGWTKGGTGTWDATNKVWTYGAGDGTLTANWNTTSNSFSLEDISNAKTGYTCAWHQGSASGTVVKDNITITGNTTFYAVCTINQYTLTIKPNGGKWNNKTTDSAIKSNYNSKYPTSGTLPDATDGPTYSISYNANSQGATCSGISSTSCDGTTTVARPFTNWTKGGTGTWDATNKVWTYGAGDGTLTANWNNTSNTFTLPSISKTGHTCYWASNTTGTKFGNGGESKTITANTPLYAYCTVNQYKLTVNPNGGTWGGSTASQSFTQNYNTTKTISNPTATPTYSITYNANGQGASYTGSPTSVARPFTSWSLSGAGSFAGGTYTYGAGNGTLTAQYSATSNSFTLPTITKPFTICGWREGSASGKYYAGGTSRTITGNTTYYASCNTVITYMHQMTSAICAATPVGSSIELSDKRESGRKYGVRKLKDGRCWMTGPLVISAAQTLKSDTSDVSSDVYWNPGDCNSESSPCIKFVDRRPTSPWVTFLYNYPAATAKQNPSSGNATRSICPKGWKLPSTTEFTTLKNNYPSYSAMTNGGPQFYPYGIYWGGNTWTDADDRGLYWASNASSASNAYFLEVRKSASGVYPSENWSKGINISIKCVAR